MKKRLHKYTTGQFRLLVVMVMVFTMTVLLTACGHEHSFGDWEIEKAPTCLEDGLNIRFCDCGEEKTRKVSATGHQDGEWIVDADATCTTDGSMRLVCAVCNDTIQTKTIAAAGGHVYSEEITTAASCENSGVKTFTCTVCGDSYTETVEYPSYTATEVYENNLGSVGEVITYDKSGNEFALGTCFVYTGDGKLITNYHVIEDAYSAKVLFGDKTYEVQQVLAYDKDIDLAVLKISASDLTPVTLCAESHKVGEVVYAFGSSKGMTATFSEGIITHSNRVVENVSYTQHDAPISSGNSGGPLINRYGEVIGVNTWTVRDSQNLNFAINVSELDNLDYGTPLTMAELYKKECDPFAKLKSYIIEEGSYKSSGNYYVVSCGTHTSGANTFTRRAYYYLEDNTITFDLIINNGEFWTYFEVDETLDGTYYWEYFDDNDFKMYGTLYASTYDKDTLLGYSYNNINYAALRDSVRELASNNVHLICLYIDVDFAALGITANDLGFSRY